MKINTVAVRKCLKSFDFPTLFREQLGWDKHQATLDVPVDGSTVRLSAIAQKRGFVAYVCTSIPDRAVRLKIDHQVTKSAHEHFVIYSDQTAGQQVWHWVRREPGKPLASRDHRFDTAQSGDPLIQRLNQIAVSIDEEESITVVDVAGRARAAFDVDKVTKKFYERFKAEHTAFMKFIKGIKAEADLEWYTSLMLNRLMFVYFIQKKGFLDGDTDYLRNRMRLVRDAKGKDKFLSFYRYFLLRLFHDGLGKAPDERKLDREMEKLLGTVPFLNGGFFEVHQLEERNPDIDIPDKAFEKLFDFFDDFRWHLDERPLRADNEINPDVVGYIFEKYINQKQMGAYYTKEDITGYISKNTVIPFLFDAAEKKCPIAFKPDSFLWRLLRDDPDRYIFPAVRHGVLDPRGEVIPLPPAVAAGVNDVAKRGGWNQPASGQYGLPTETWREHVARRNRCLELRQKLKSGEVHTINDLITLNLDIWQFARDAIVNCEGPELLRAFWHAIEKVTVLDPTCGSGAFLFAALRILESLYSDCLERMERFVEDLAGGDRHPETYRDFKAVLAQIADHPSDKYFILKSIIISNLFGVDIMEEAVEICKLRLFLKLVAQVETADQIEPLPDIDFNIRAGNTLVGYVSLDQVRKSQAGTLGFGANEVQRIEEDALAVEKCFEQFRAQQTKHGGKVTAKDKQELRRRLQKLDAELDRYLAGEYGIAVDNFKTKAAFEEAFAKWRTSHEPFHWFVEFYGIMHAGGFDVIIGNPPYVEYDRKLQTQYSVKGYRTENCGNLHAFIAEKCFSLTTVVGRFGLIVPLPSINTSRMESLQRLVKPPMSEKGRSLWVSSFDERPSNLFSGVDQRLVIEVFGPICGSPTLATTGINRWQSDCRETLFPTIAYALQSAPVRSTTVSILKLKQAGIESSMLTVFYSNEPIEDYKSSSPTGQILAYRTAGGRYWKIALDRPFDSESLSNKTANLKGLTGEQAAAILMSSTFWWYYSSHFDMYNLKDYMIFGFRFSNPSKGTLSALEMLGAELQKSLRQNSVEQTIRSKTRGEVTSRLYVGNRSKPVIDKIDAVLAAHYGFSPEQLEFVQNYDIKFRMGGSDADVEQ